MSTLSLLSQVSPISIYVAILAAFRPVQGKRVATLLPAVATLAVLPPAPIDMITLAPILSRWPRLTGAFGRRPSRVGRSRAILTRPSGQRWLMHRGHLLGGYAGRRAGEYL